MTGMLKENLVLIGLARCLGLKDLVRLGLTCRRLHGIIVTGADFLSHQALWHALCDREGLRAPSGAAWRALYHSHCLNFYMLELVAPQTHPLIHVCADPTSAARALHAHFDDSERLAIQHLCVTGMDLCVYAGFKHELRVFKPLYDQLVIRLGSQCALTFRFLGARGVEVESDPTAHTRRMRLADEGFVLRRTFFRSALVCRYEVNHWVKPSPESEGRAADLFCDMVLLPLTVELDTSRFPIFSPAGRPLAGETSITLSLPDRASQRPNLRHADGRIELPTMPPDAQQITLPVGSDVIGSFSPLHALTADQTAQSIALSVPSQDLVAPVHILE